MPKISNRKPQTYGVMTTEGGVKPANKYGVDAPAKAKAQPNRYGPFNPAGENSHSTGDAKFSDSK